MTTRTFGFPRDKANLLVLAYIAFVSLGLPTGLIGVAWPTLRGEFSMPLDALGLLLISSTAGYLVSSFTIARLITRFGIGALLVVSSLLSALSLVGYTVAPNWGFFIGMGAIGGFGSGLMDAGLNTYLAAEYNEGQMQWLHASFGAGATLSPLIMTESLTRLGSWKPAYLFVAALMVAMTVTFVLTISAWKRPRRFAEEAVGLASGAHGIMDYRTPLWKTLLRLVTWISILMFLLYTGAELTLGNWTYTLFTVGRGVSPQVAGIWAGGFWATFTAGRVMAGLYAHRIRLNTLMIGALVLALIGAIMFWWNPIALVGVAGVFVVGFAMAPIFPGLVSSTSRRVGARDAGNTIGIQISAAGLGGALLPALAGLLAEHLSLEAIPAMLTVSLFGLLILYLGATRRSSVPAESP